MKIIVLRLKIITLGAFLGAFYGLVAQDNTPKYSNEFLSLGVGAQAFGMGGTQVAITSDVTAGYWNPAGLMGIETDQQLMLMHAVYYSGIGNYDFGAFSIRVADSSRLALSIIRFSVDDIPDTRFLFDANGAVNYDNIQFFSASDYAGLLSYATRINKLGGMSIGGNIKVVHRLVGSFSKAWGFGLDAGIQKEMGRWKLGLSGRDIFGTFNAWSHDSESFRQLFNQTGNDVPVNTIEITLPSWILGVAYPVTISEQIKVCLTADPKATFDGKRNTLLKTNLVSLDPLGAIEVAYNEMIYLRYGIGQFQQIENMAGNQKLKFQLSGGLGLRFKDFTLDYALTDFGGTSTGLYSHVFSVKIDFHDKSN
jgi:hypothetical protein